MLLRDLLAEVEKVISGAERLDDDVRAGARRESRLLAAGVLDCSPAEISIRLTSAIDATNAGAIRRAAGRRAEGEPLAYCVGRAAFRHLVLSVDGRVLIPRPETELLIDHALRLTSHASGGIAVDIGTGSGAIALSLALEGRFDLVIATDISKDALSVASENARWLPADAAPVEFLNGAGASVLVDVRARIIVSNPPYISYVEACELPKSVRDWEPPVALFAANDGLAVYDDLFAHAHKSLVTGGWLVLEVDSRRAAETARLAVESGYQAVEIMKDLTGRERILLAQAMPAC